MYVLRKNIEHELRAASLSDDDCYFCSLSAATMVYKGQLTPRQVPEYFLDLQDDKFRTYLSLVHSRFSTVSKVRVLDRVRVRVQQLPVAGAQPLLNGEQVPISTVVIRLRIYQFCL